MAGWGGGSEGVAGWGRGVQARGEGDEGAGRRTLVSDQVQPAEHPPLTATRQASGGGWRTSRTTARAERPLDRGRVLLRLGADDDLRHVFFIRDRVQALAALERTPRLCALEMTAPVRKEL